jgi:Fe(3+) dicitrate transport protein
MARLHPWLAASALLLGFTCTAFAEDPPVLPPVPTTPPPAPAAGEPEEGQAPLLEVERAPGVPLEGKVTGPLPVIGANPQEALRTIPGSGSSVTQAEIRKWREVISVKDAVKTLPGIVTRDEVASDLVPNIGVRGLNPDRSEKLLILEDGVPSGLAPYVENAAYYIPPFERMERIELLKGSGSILYGPHTVGGVLNLITPEIPDCFSGFIRAVAGTEGYAMGYAQAGETVGRWGYLVTALGKRGDGWRDNAGFEIADLTAKVRWTPSACTNLTLKLNLYEAESEDTYLGLTRGMFEQDPYQNPVESDTLDIQWYSGQLTWQQQLSSCWQVLTNVYYSFAERDWNRQDYARNVGFAPAPANTVATVGDVTVDGGAVYLRASYGSRDREFEKWGVEPRLIGTHTLFGRPAETHVGMRFHTEEMIDARNNRTSLYAAPVTRDRDVRSVDAWAAFAQEKVQVTSRLGLSAGLRVEIYEEDRHITMQAGAPVDIRGSTDNVEWIPGAGFTYALATNHTVFGGFHRGFSPPRTAQAISSTGQDLELDAERSWEYELGIRGYADCVGCPWLRYELTGFYYDFENQVVPANQSGGAGTADTNAGQTEHLGFETVLTFDLTRLFTRRCDPCRTAWFFETGYTFVDTENVTNGGTFEGLDLPYAPEHVGWAGLRFEAPSGLSGGIVARYVGDQFSDQANTVPVSETGLVGVIDDHVVVDLVVRYRVPRTHVTVSFALNNIFDETYVASRAPEGTFPGTPLHGFLGVEIDF